MADEMTAQQLTDLRFDLADIQTAFTDAELNRQWVRAAGSSTDGERFRVTKGLVILALLHDAAKFFDYTAGQTEQKRAQIFDHYRTLYQQFYASAVDGILGGGGQVFISVWRMRPNPDRTEPES